MGRQFELNLLDEPEDVPDRDAVFRDPREPGLAVIAIDHRRLRVSHPARSQKAQPAFLPANCLASDAFRLTLQQCKWHIVANMPVVEARDAEGVHQLRVGLRRLRVALSAFGGDFRNPQLETVRLRAKALSRRLAPARDLDIFLREMLEPAATANGALDAFQALRDRAWMAWRQAWNEAVAEVTGDRFRVFLGDLGEAIDRPSWRGRLSGEGHVAGRIPAFEAPASMLADRTLTHRLKRARKMARNLESLSDAQRHDLRISLKKLRYTAEFFATFYESRKVSRFLSRLSRMQDTLGALNDVAVARDILDMLVRAGDADPLLPVAELSFAAGIVYGWHLNRAAHIRKDIVSRWKKFSRTEPFWTAVEAR